MRRTAFLAAALALLLSGSVIAQPTVSVRGNVGAAFFQGPNSLNSVLNSGVDLGVETGIQLYDGIELVVQGSYDRFTLNEDNVLLSRQGVQPGEEFEVEGGDFYFLGAAAGLRYLFMHEGNAHPYITAGTGLYRTTVTEFNVYEEGSHLNPDTGERRSMTSTGVHVALGINFQIDETYSVFFEPRYVIVYTRDRDFGLVGTTRYVPVRLGLDLRF